jgi:mRNA (guanine-N7-)-methyltransferase
MSAGGGDDDDHFEHVSKKSRAAATDALTSDRVLAVASHYSGRQQQSAAERAQSVTIGLKSFNNWLKTVLLNLYCRRSDFVLDLCSGKGGDLTKWTRLRVGAVVFADVASESVKHSLERYLQMRSSRKCDFPAFFVDADCSQANLFSLHPAMQRFTQFGHFDFVSCQFALHYAFETEARARALVRNAASRLRPGGHFVCTVPNAHLIVKRLRSTRGLSYGNELYRIRVEAPKNVAGPLPAFGAEYFFTLIDAVEDCPEYLVHPAVLESIAADYGLELVLHQPFDEFYRLHIDIGGNRDIMQRMGADNVSDAEWEAICVYSVFAFRKRGTPQRDEVAHVPPSAINEPLPTVDDIIRVTAAATTSS